MSEYIRHNINLPKDKGYIEIYQISDMHVGSLAFHEEAYIKLRNKIKRKKAYVTFVGDATEGKLVSSPHFNPDGLKRGCYNVQAQAEYFIKLWEPIAKQTLLLMPGNHDQYLSRDFDVMSFIAERLKLSDSLGSYQSWLNVNGMTMHFWHGRPTMPRGAKDPIQREANQKAWLKNKLAPLAGSAIAQYMAHTHQCLIVEPIHQYALLDSGENCKGRSFTEQARDVDGAVWVPPDARWYVNTGTFRRGGMFGFQDYAEEAGYGPAPICCTKTVLEDGKVKEIVKVLV